jgi:hypothetical protein
MQFFSNRQTDNRDVSCSEPTIANTLPAVCFVCLQHEGGWVRVPGKAVLNLLSAEVRTVEEFFSKASIHWWELQQVRRTAKKLRACPA